MKNGAQISWLPDGKRMHLHHGPIDLVIEIWGSGKAEAYQRAATRFQSVLQELVDELPDLRQPASNNTCFRGDIARVMNEAVTRYLPSFVTPMAAVAGAVADEIAQVISETPNVTKAYVNNGGDIALVLEGEAVMVTDIGGGIARATLHGRGSVRGVATSGWRGRSLSFGIADAVSVLAGSAALADVAATVIANAVDLPSHHGIVRATAESQQLDSDLGTRLVTIAVTKLHQDEVSAALDRGLRVAQSLGKKEGVLGGLLALQGQVRSFGNPSFSKRPIDV
ncbi:UPF0280 family protein [Shimia sagamensis]|uniref:Uncharacterized protein n=1 Tax=Shimia sagamensis TaxID=1566352 RepID=A0ABY1NHU7_9RHOB|nr:UPF0280 family protein [Shimia sagamensis]SMP10151.1 hypothetical protein SAMN06265373_10295 [Shimia sagamensis]